MTFTIKRGDTSPNIVFELKNSNETNRNISGYNNIRFYMRDATTAEVIISEDISGNVIVEDSQRGYVEYDWSEGDTKKSGLYHSEVEVEFSNGSIETFPNNGFVEIEILEDIE